MCIEHLGVEYLTGIALIADKDTVTCFKLAGLNEVHSVENGKEAEKCLKALLEKKNVRIYLISEQLLNKIQNLGKIIEHYSPLIIPIPELQSQKMLKTDLIAELIKHKTGIDVKF